MVEKYKLQASFQEGRLANANSIPLSSNPFDDNELELKLSWSNGWGSQNSARAKPIRNFAALENKSNLYKEGWDAYRMNTIEVDQPKESSANKIEEEWSLGWLACKRYSVNSVNPPANHKDITDAIESFFLEEINLRSGNRHERIKSKVFLFDISFFLRNGLSATLLQYPLRWTTYSYRITLLSSLSSN